MIQISVLNWFSWNSHGWCGSTHGWTLLFLETIDPIEPPIWGKFVLKTNFLGLSQTVCSFLKKKLKNCIWYPFPQKRLYSFCRLTLHLSKMVMPPSPQKKLFLAVVLENIGFFWKNCQMKNIQNLNAYEKGYIDFCGQTYPFPPLKKVVSHKGLSFLMNTFLISWTVSLIHN